MGGHEIKAGAVWLGTAIAGESVRMQDLDPGCRGGNPSIQLIVPLSQPGPERQGVAIAGKSLSMCFGCDKDLDDSPRPLALDDEVGGLPADLQLTCLLRDEAFEREVGGLPE